jgi:hypothetical protein
MYHEWERRGTRIGYWCRSQKERDHYEDQDVGGWCNSSNDIIDTFRIPGYNTVDYIRMGLGEVGWGGVDSINLSQDRDRWRVLVNAVMILRVP